MNFNLIKSVMFWGTILTVGVFIVPWINKIIKKRQRQQIIKPLVVLLAIIIISSFFPIFTISAITRFSIIDFIQQGSLPFLLMIISYNLSLALFIVGKPQLDILAGVLLIIAVIFSWIGGSQYIDGFPTSKEAGFYGDAVVLFFGLLPLIAAILGSFLWIIAAHKLEKK